MQLKSANKMGVAVVNARERIERDVLLTLRDRSKQRESEEGQGALAMAHDLVASGERHEATCRAVVHEEETFADVDWKGMRDWVRSARGMAAMFRLSPEQQQRIIDRG
jgi:hypothetical protein